MNIPGHVGIQILYFAANWDIHSWFTINTLSRSISPPPGFHTIPCGCFSSARPWWFQPIWKVFVKSDHYPKYGVNMKHVWNRQTVLTLYMLQILHHEIPWEYLLKIQKLGNDVWWRTDELYDLNIFQKWPCLDSTSQQGSARHESQHGIHMKICQKQWLTQFQELFSCTCCKEWNNANPKYIWLRAQLVHSSFFHVQLVSPCFCKLLTILL